MDDRAGEISGARMTCHCSACRHDHRLNAILSAGVGVLLLLAALSGALYLTGCSLAASNAGTSIGIDLPTSSPPPTVPKLPQGHPVPTWARP